MQDKSVKSFSIWIDADSCPVAVRELIVRFATRLNIPVIYCANHAIPMPKNKLFSMIICEPTADAADNYIVENVKQNDLVITRDIPLASRLVEKNIVTLNDRGTVFTNRNIQEKLAMRNLHKELIDNGIQIEKTSVFGKKELNAFANCLDRELQRKLRQT